MLCHHALFVHSCSVCLLALCICIELALFCPLADWLFPTRFCHCRGFNEASGDLFFTRLTLLSCCLLLLTCCPLLVTCCSVSQRYAARGEVSRGKHETPPSMHWGGVHAEHQCIRWWRSCTEAQSMRMRSRSCEGTRCSRWLWNLARRKSETSMYI